MPRQVILNDISFDVGLLGTEDYGELGIGNVGSLDFDYFIQELTNRPSGLLEYSNNPGTVVFLYPIVFNINRNNRNDRYTMLKPIYYHLSDLPNALSVISAIDDFYFSYQLDNPIDLDLYNIIQGEFVRTYSNDTLSGPLVRQLFTNPLHFQGLEMIHPGIYKVKIFSES